MQGEGGQLLCMYKVTYYIPKRKAGTKEISTTIKSIRHRGE